MVLRDNTRDQHVNDKKTKAFYDWATTGIPVIRVIKCYQLSW